MKTVNDVQASLLLIGFKKVGYFVYRHKNLSKPVLIYTNLIYYNNTRAYNTNYSFLATKMSDNDTSQYVSCDTIYKNIINDFNSKS